MIHRNECACVHAIVCAYNEDIIVIINTTYSKIKARGRNQELSIRYCSLKLLDTCYINAIIIYVSVK